MGRENLFINIENKIYKIQSKSYVMNGGRIIILLVFLSVFTLVQAQVTIGTDDAPVSGMLLQLKEVKEVDLSSANGYVNASKGLGLPRINMNVTSSTSGDAGAKLVASLNLTGVTLTADQAKMHTGLIVFNINTSDVTQNAPFSEAKVCPGVYVWMGTEWSRAMVKACE